MVYGSFIATVDVLVMGRKTYEVAKSFLRWPYGTRRVYVLSGGYPESGKPLSKTVIGTSSQPTPLVEQLSAEGFERAYVDGGMTIQAFLRAGLINDFTITRMPILLGEGVPLFGVTGRDISLRHIETKAYPNGFVQSRYEVLPAH
jgi:dihydrofolate reductase